jgi:hypothetical protein
MKISNVVTVTVAALVIGGLFLLHRLNQKANEPAMTRGDGGSIYLHKEEIKYQQRAATNSPAPTQSLNQVTQDLGTN